MGLYLMRHGATKMNLEHRVQGHINAELSDTGREQAQNAGQELKALGVNFTKAISSPLFRAVETASIASGLEIDEVETNPDIIEIDFGVHDGSCFAEMDKGALDAIFCYPSERGKRDGVECYESLKARCENFLRLARKLDSIDNDILILTHGGCMRGILSLIMGIPQEELWTSFDIPNCKTYRLVLDPEDESFKNDRAEVVLEGYKLRKR